MPSNINGVVIRSNHGSCYDNLGRISWSTIRDGTVLHFMGFVSIGLISNDLQHLSKNIHSINIVTVVN